MVAIDRLHDPAVDPDQTLGIASSHGVTEGRIDEENEPPPGGFLWHDDVADKPEVAFRLPPDEVVVNGLPVDDGVDLVDRVVRLRPPELKRNMTFNRGKNIFGKLAQKSINFRKSLHLLLPSLFEII
ncbi:MAG: hypothetical protein H6R00_3261 [Proteobacteria bacterium]|nr:hypothetical protein [Pseudomonadota bacterium]